MAGDCVKRGSVCKDGPGSKNISGQMIYRDCWQYEDTYDCIEPDAVNYCQPLINAGCSVINSTCGEWNSVNGTICNYFNNQYVCAGKTLPNPLPQNVTYLDTSYTVAYDQLDTSACTSLADNASCTYAGKTCTEGPATKIIDGASVYRDCWTWKYDYVCATADFKDYCAPLKAAGCTEKGVPDCTSKAWDNSCMTYSHLYACGVLQGTPLPENVVYLSSSYSIASDTIDTSACDQFANNPNCTYGGRTCIEGPETRTINGLAVYKDCWKWRDEYTCAGLSLTTNCTQLRNSPNCVELSSLCVDWAPDGSCSVLEHTYKCTIEGSGRTDTRTTCSAQKFCINGQCFETGYPPDSDMGQALAMLEASREAGVYLDKVTFQLFKGEISKCTKGVFGMGNCCSVQNFPGASNYDVAQQVGVQGIGFGLQAGAEWVYAYGSKVVFDELMKTGVQYIQNIAIEAAGKDLIQLNYNGTASFYGLTFDVTSQGISFVGFDPWSFAIAVAIQVIQEMMSCTSDELQLSMARGKGLCHHVGTYCADSVFGACVQLAESFCCYNSKLARIIAEGIRAQIPAIGWGTGEVPDCSGVTAETLGQVDFSKIDFSEFIGDIMPTGKDFGPAVGRATTRMQNYFAK
jgi:conjugal transfer mating pair stabilization protein TraN